MRPPTAPEFLAGGGDMGALMRAHDWTRSPLGPPETWPDALKMSVSICLNSRFPMVLWWGPDFVMLYNDAWRPVLGESKHPGGLGQPGVESWPEIWDIIGEQLGGVLYRGEASWSEDLLLVLERYGYREEAYFTYSYSPIKHADGTIGGVFSAVNETTERVLGERRLRILRELAEQTADAKSVEAACATFAGVLGDNNPDLPFALLYLVSEDGRTARRLASAGFDPGDERAPAEIGIDAAVDPWHVAEVVRTGRTVLVDDLAQRFGDLPGGAWPEPTTAALVLPVAKAGQGGETTGVLVAGINPRRALDDAYRGFLELVAGHMATAVTNARAYEEERRRAEALAEIDRQKTAFFSNVSHEFRTPLTLMLGPLEDALADAAASLPAPQRDRLDVAHRNALRLLRLVNALLDFSRIQAGRVQASFRPTDLGRLTAELASSFRSATERAGLDLIVECRPLSEPVHVDRDMWEKIVLNLVSNAFKFTLEGGIEVMLEQIGRSARLTVRDTGIGIPDAELPRLFERFHRIEGAKGRSFEGSGIGLALVHDLVKLHGGEIAVESAVGRGTTFTVALPLGTAHLPPDRIDAVSSGASTAVRAEAFVEEALRWLPDEPTAPALLDVDAIRNMPRTGVDRIEAAERRRVLLADDNADLRSYIARLLADDGYEVETVADGRAALEALRASRPDLLITDMMMPRLDGFGLLREVRGDARLRDLPVIMLSARAGEEAKVEGFEAGADDYLTKPFSARELLARVSAALAMAEMRRESETRLRNVVLAAPFPNMLHAEDGEVLELSRRWCELTGYAREEIRTHFDWMRLAYPGEGLAEVERAIAQAFAAEGETHDGEFEIRTKDGSRRIWDFHGVPLGRLPDGRRFRISAAVDVTERKNAEQVLRELNETLAARVAERTAERDRIWSLSQDPFLIADAQGRWLSVSPAWTELLGWSEQEVLGRTSEWMEHPEDRAKTRAEIEQLATGRTTRRFENRFRAKDGSYRWFSWMVVPEDGFLYCVARDVTAEKEAAAELERTQEALRQAQKMEAVGQLTGGIAHDFNNLLTVVIGNVDMARRALDAAGGDARAKRAMDNALKGAERAAALTQRLLAFSRRQPLSPKPTDVDRLLAGMADLLHRSLGETVELELVTSPGLWKVEVDPNQLESAVLNLAVNARDAMPNGGKLTIETANARLDESYAANHAEVAPGNYVVIAVTDTGTGMSKEALARAFEPFFTTKEIGQGTGLGLSMVYGFTKQSGGHVKIYSEEREGTTVKIYLPRLMAEVDQDEESLSPAAEVSRREDTILVVEDDDDVRAYTVEILRELGYRVLEAHDGPSALRLLERQETPVQLLFTDVVMPGMSGRELADKARERKPDLKVLYTSGYTRNAVVHGGRLDPGVEMIVKPFTYQGLAQPVRDVLDAGQTGRVLVVEDEPTVRMFAIEALTANGYAAEEAADAAEALSKVRAAGGRYDVVVLDASLPDRHGDALAIELRALHADLPILIASGEHEAELHARFAGDRCTAVIGKPYNVGKLHEALTALGVKCASRRKADPGPG